MRNALAAIALVLGLAGPATADTGWHIQQSGTVGCVLRSDAEQIVYLPPTDDVRALARKLVMSGRCIILAGGAEVVIVPKGVMEDIVAVRRPADSAFLFVDRWTVQGPKRRTSGMRCTDDPEDLRRQRRYDNSASIETLMLLDEAFEARQKIAMRFDDPGGTLVWSPAEMVDLLQAMAQSADRRTLSFGEAASIARGRRI